MSGKLHKRREADDMRLALLRTRLANRRTLLTYCNASLAIGLTGVGFLKLMDHQFYAYMGRVLVILSPVVITIGVYDYLTTRKRILAEQEDAEV